MVNLLIRRQWGDTGPGNWYPMTAWRSNCSRTWYPSLSFSISLFAKDSTSTVMLVILSLSKFSNPQQFGFFCWINNCIRRTVRLLLRLCLFLFHVLLRFIILEHHTRKITGLSTLKYQFWRRNLQGRLPFVRLRSRKRVHNSIFDVSTSPEKICQKEWCCFFSLFKMYPWFVNAIIVRKNADMLPCSYDAPRAEFETCFDWLHGRYFRHSPHCQFVIIFEPPAHLRVSTQDQPASECRFCLFITAIVTLCFKGTVAHDVVLQSPSSKYGATIGFIFVPLFTALLSDDWLLIWIEHLTTKSEGGGRGGRVRA